MGPNQLGSSPVPPSQRVELNDAVHNFLPSLQILLSFSVMANGKHDGPINWFPHIEALVKLLRFKNLPPYLKDALTDALRDAKAAFIQEFPNMNDTIWSELEPYDLSVVGVGSQGNSQPQIYDMQYEMNEIETRREYYPSTISLINLINALIAEERDFTDGGLKFAGVFRFIYDHVFVPLTERAYADPSKKWQLVVACLLHFQMILTAYDVKDEDFDGATKRSQSEMQLPIVELMKDFMSGKTVFRFIMLILLPGVKVVTAECANQVHRQLLEKAEHLSLDIIALVLKKELPLADCWRPVYQHLDTSGVALPNNLQSLRISSLHKDLFNSCGTTVLAFIKGESVFTFVDSRISRVTKEKEYSITTDNSYKYLNFPNILPNIVGTKSGSDWGCNKMEAEVSKRITEVGPMSIEELARFTYSFLETSAETKPAFLRVTTILATGDTQGPKMLLVNAGREKCPKAFEKNQCAVSGSGGPLAATAFNSRKDWHELSDAECITWAQIAVTYAIFRDPYSGGTIRGRKITKDRPILYINEDPVKILLKNYEDFIEVENKMYIRDSEHEDTLPKEFSDATLFIISPGHLNLSYNDMIDYIRVEAEADVRPSCSWGALGDTQMNLALITFAGDPITACMAANTLYEKAKCERAKYLANRRSHPGHKRDKRPRFHYDLPWLVHDWHGQFLFVGRGRDADLRARMLASLRER